LRKLAILATVTCAAADGSHQPRAHVPRFDRCKESLALDFKNSNAVPTAR
jgi:hypothetical protein